MTTYLKNMEGWKHKDLKSKDFESSQNCKHKKVDDVQETAKVDNDQEAAKIKEPMKIVFDEEEVAIDAIPLDVKPPSIVDCKIHTEGKKSYYQIIRSDGKSRMYLVFSHMLKSFDREDLETLWKLVKASMVNAAGEIVSTAEIVSAALVICPSLWELSSVEIISINITSPSSSLVQTSSALGDGGTNPRDSKSELNLRTFSVMNEIDRSGGVGESGWFSGLPLSSSSFSLLSVVEINLDAWWMDRDGVDRTVNLC
ncbi:hypothetical protein Tco_0044324 [Tanacetum coccineum]